MQQDGTNSSIDHCRTESNATYTALTWLMTGEFVLGLPLNLSVLYVFIFRFKFWKNNSLLLFNIVVADFLLVACLPVKIYHYYHNQRRSKDLVVCRLMLFMLFLNRGASIAFLITLSLDRYFSVVHLGRKNLVKRIKKSPLFSLLVWVLLLPFTTPTMLKHFSCCNSHGRVVETSFHDVVDTLREIIFFGQIIIPFFILVYCTTCIVRRLNRKTVGEKARLRRAVGAVLSVAVVFFVCFIPCAIARMVLIAVRLKNASDLERVAVQVFDSLMVLSYTDCLLDPMVYCFCHSGFKSAYISTFCPKFLQRRLLNSDSAVPIATTTTTGTTATKVISLQVL